MEKKKFLLRIDANLYAALEKWAADDLRSINAQIEFLLSDSAKKANRLALLKSKEPHEDTERENDSERDVI